MKVWTVLDQSQLQKKSSSKSKYKMYALFNWLWPFFSSNMWLFFSSYIDNLHGCSPSNLDPIGCVTVYVGRVWWVDVCHWSTTLHNGLIL